MFTSVKTESGYIFPPLLFHQAITNATSSVKLSNFAGIALKQMEGTGWLNYFYTRDRLGKSNTITGPL